MEDMEAGPLYIKENEKCRGWARENSKMCRVLAFYIGGLGWSSAPHVVPKHCQE